MTNKRNTIINNERGDIGIKQIAITVAVIVVIGLIIGVVRSNMSTWVNEVWRLFMDQIDSLIR
ncbi:hypothetical protein EDC19_2414 [Natranaerovirga hydrolytica]|uniref:Uncharacterized protein n=1 Tax=Natranaerovirga hydrolytica TaxID=680378 RepID=A0A4R1MEJ6_9FIRM|nr:hypothetical protein [Natranaerovirga hydrolytica]TCK90645.1 hypothetical protein EDC19_2414 [Natranaerovirga hydrolytica]